MTGDEQTQDAIRDDCPVEGARVLVSRTGLALWSFLLLTAGLYVGKQLYTGRPVTVPRPKFFAGSPAGGGPLPTAATREFQPPPELKTTVREIEEPSGKAVLVPFFQALRRTERRQPGAVTRVCHWGDSQIVSDNITTTLRRRLQKRFGDSGHGFVSVGRPENYLHSDVKHYAAKAWRFAGVVQPVFGDRMYGLSGIHTYARSYGPASTFGTRPTFEVGRRVSRFEVSYLEHREGGRFQLWVDGKLHQTVNTRRPEGAREAVARVTVPDGDHSLTLRAVGYGTVRLFGAVLERDEPGVVYDSLGLKGAQLHDLLRNNPAHFLRQLRWRQPSLLVFGFGTNESYQSIPMTEYLPKWKKLFRFVTTALPQTSCLVLGPVDRVYRGRESHPRIPRLTGALRVAALSSGCAFWDTFAAMGGAGAAMRWRRAGLVWGDLAHLKPEGGERLGGMIAKALVERYQAWLQRARYEEKRRGAR
ncbi:MAG: hypothetical protein ABI333_29520 [bacterium]